MAYLIANRVLGVVFLLVFVFFVCAISAIRWNEIKADFSAWNRRRKLHKLLKPTKKGLHR